MRGLPLNALVVNGLNALKDMNLTQCIDDQSFLDESLRRRTTQQEITSTGACSIFERDLCRRLLRTKSSETDALRYIDRTQLNRPAIYDSRSKDPARDGRQGLVNWCVGCPISRVAAPLSWPALEVVERRRAGDHLTTSSSRARG